jgi:tRNA A-37 threonylcarbamoyl transferase component Bud32
MDTTKQEKLLKSLSGGLSGCKLSISRDGRFVTKTSSNNNYNPRLAKQIEKQKIFKKMLIKGIECPDIIETGKGRDGLDFFTMEYAIGKDFKDFLNCSSPNEIVSFTNSIFTYIEAMRLTESIHTEVEFSAVCIEKLESIKKNIPDLLFFEFLHNKLLRMEKINVPISFCHGDLTLSNILFSNKKIFFLDFLDSYIESWIIDLVKLKQDLFYFWSYLRDDREPSLRLIQASIKIWNSIEEKYPEFVFSNEFKILEALNFLRIYPYAREEKDLLIIENILKKLPIYEEFNNPNGR